MPPTRRLPGRLDDLEVPRHPEEPPRRASHDRRAPADRGLGKLRDADTAEAGRQQLRRPSDAERSLVRGNIIDGNGTGITFSGDEDSASSDNVVEHNVIANSRTRWNVESFFPSTVGSGNLAAGNCVWASNPE